MRRPHVSPEALVLASEIGEDRTQCEAEKHLEDGSDEPPHEQAFALQEGAVEENPGAAGGEDQRTELEYTWNGQFRRYLMKSMRPVARLMTDRLAKPWMKQGTARTASMSAMERVAVSRSTQKQHFSTKMHIASTLGHFAPDEYVVASYKGGGLRIAQ